MADTIEYYNKNAEKFFDETINVDMSEIYERFEKYLKSGERILDCGCGSGRDSRYFLEKGYDVVSIDGSSELCQIASEITGKEVKCMKFEDINFKNEFNGIWACSSLLHAEKSSLKYIFKKLEEALKDNGRIYVSFKYGNFEGERNGRYFTNLSEKELEEILKENLRLKIKETWITGDKRKARNSEKWLNAIIIKIKTF